MASDNKDISRRVFEEIWNHKKLNVIDELMAPDYVHHDTQSPDVLKGIEGHKQFVSHYLNAFPDLHYTIEDLIADGDIVAIRWIATGTHQKDLPGIPKTGRQFSVTGMTIARVRDGKLIESWGNWDALGLMQQLGIVPAGSRDWAA